MKILYTFPHSYEVEILDPVSNTIYGLQKYHFPREGIEDQGWKCIKVTPLNGKPWIGSFAPGYFPSNATSQVLSYPNPYSLCVISHGKGYIIDSRNPNSYIDVDAYPIFETHAIVGKGLIFFVDFTLIVAYDANGKKWETDRLSSDGLKVIEINNKFIRLRGWDAPSNCDTEILVDCDTGDHKIIKC